VRKQEYTIWSSYQREWWPAYGGEVQGIEEIEQGLGLDVVPSVNLTQQRDLVLNDSKNVLNDSKNNFEPSLDVRYRITPSLSATLTLNTDFSTAEIDEQQTSSRSRSIDSRCFFPRNVIFSCRTQVSSNSATSIPTADRFSRDASGLVMTASRSGSMAASSLRVESATLTWEHWRYARMRMATFQPRTSS
jgi:hypothetical protein